MCLPFLADHHEFLQVHTVFVTCLSYMSQIACRGARAERQFTKIRAVHTVVYRITKLIEDVRQTYVQLLKTSTEFSQQLLEMQTARKQNQRRLRNRLKESRLKLIHQFETALLNIESKIFQETAREDENFIVNLMAIDQRLETLRDNITQKQEMLNKKDCLGVLIQFFSQGDIYAAEIDKLREEASRVRSRSYCLTVSSAQLAKIKQSLLQYLQVSILEATA